MWLLLIVGNISLEGEGWRDFHYEVFKIEIFTLLSILISLLFLLVALCLYLEDNAYFLYDY